MWQPDGPDQRVTTIEPTSGISILLPILRPSRADAVLGPLYPRYFRDIYWTNDMHHGVEGHAFNPAAA
jgi:hypothetical protein